jgi:hypothetical protein
VNKLGIILFVFIYCGHVFAKDYYIEFQTPKFYYKAKITKKTAHIEGSLIDLNLKQNKCSQKIAKSFYRSLNMKLKKQVLTKVKKDSYRVSINGKKMNIYKDSSLGRYLFQMPNIFKKLKVKEQIVCK